MGKQGIVLIMGLIVAVVVSILLSSFFFGVINENRLVQRFVNSTRAFWLAETGVAEAASNMPNSISGTLGDPNYTYSAATTLLSGNYYQIDSTGSVNLGPSGTISRALRVIVRTSPVDPGSFQDAISTTGDLIIRGSVTINGSQEEFASFSFADLFEHSKEEIKSYATNLYTDPPVNVTPIDGITWVDVSAGQEFRISSDTWSGSGILVVAGDAQLAGGTFTGIIYVIGQLRMSGNLIINGSVYAESQTEIDTTLTGNVTINYDSDAIGSALVPLTFITPVIVSWQET